MDTVRLILDKPAAGAWNMAVDEALLDSAVSGLTTLRFYHWQEPTLSLGYFQPVVEREGHAASCDCPLVRRASGGGAIVHDRELTYSFAAPDEGRFGAAEMYALFHETLIETLAEWGVSARLCNPASNPSPPAPLPQGERGERNPASFLCFERHTPGDVLCDGSKIAGSAQRRHRGGLLQHGSVLLGKSVAAPELAGIAELAEVSIEPKDLATCWLAQLRTQADWNLVPGALTEQELAAATRYEQERFASPAWNCRR